LKYYKCKHNYKCKQYMLASTNIYKHSLILRYVLYTNIQFYTKYIKHTNTLKYTKYVLYNNTHYTYS